MEKLLLVTQVHSTIGRPDKQRRIIRGLGLKKLHQTVIHNNRPEIRGMIAKVLHLVECREVDADEVQKLLR